MDKKRQWKVLNRRLSTFVLQFLPLASDILLAGINITRSFGYRGGLLVPQDGTMITYHVMAGIIIVLWWVYLMLSSIACGFCRLHRIQLSYFMFAYSCICIQRWNRSELVIDWLAHLCATMGVILIVYTFAYIAILKRKMLCSRQA